MSPPAQVVSAMGWAWDHEPMTPAAPNASSRAGAETHIKVAIVEDQSDILHGLSALIQGTRGFVCMGAYTTMEAALDRIAMGAIPDVALLDIDLPNMNGVDGVKILRQRWPSISPLMLTIHDDNDRIMDALCNGADGYLLKSTAPARLLEAIQEASFGGSPMSPEIARQVVELFRRVQPPRQADYQLTPHEMRILQMLVGGANYKSAAAKLGVSVNTVSYHVRHIYEKLHVHSRSEAVTKALRSGLFR